MCLLPIPYLPLWVLFFLSLPFPKMRSLLTKIMSRNESYLHQLQYQKYDSKQSLLKIFALIV